MTREQVCSQHSSCIGCPLTLGSKECHSLSQSEIDDIMFVVGILEKKKETIRMTKESMKNAIELVRSAPIFETDP